MSVRKMSLAKRRRIFAANGEACAECGTTIGPFELDHEICLGIGGSDDDKNIRPLCVPCHSRKSRTDIGRIAKAKRQERKHALNDEARAERERRAAKKRKIPSRKADKTWKKKLTGETVRR